MTKRLTLNEEVNPFFDTDDKQVWDLILDNNIEELLTLLPRENNNILDTIIKEFLSEGESNSFDNYDFKVFSPENGVLFRNLVRLVFALDINGNYDQVQEKIINKLFDSTPTIVERIQKDTFGYPNRRIEDIILAEAATIRAALMSLIYYFRQKEDIDSLHFAIVMRTQLTLAILNNHKNVVGHDMIEAAKIKEQVGETVAAMSFYNAARENLKNELHWFIESPEMGPNEDDVVMLQSLKEAYIAIDRLNETSEFVQTCLLIDEVLGREYIEYDFEDDEEDDD